MNEIFRINREQIRDVVMEAKCFGETPSEIEQRLVAMISERKDALVSAWVAETGLKPSESVICSGWKDGVMRTWVETKADNDKRAHVAPLYTKEQYGL